VANEVLIREKDLHVLVFQTECNADQEAITAGGSCMASVE